MQLTTVDYNGHPITIRDDGWFNATEAAARFGKKPTNWLTLPDADRYMKALARNLNVRESDLYTTKPGRYGGGTWMHPKLAVVFARWLDDDFAVWCDGQIEDVIKSKLQGSDAEYLPTYHALHSSVDALAAESQNKKFVHMNFNKLINSTIGVKAGRRHDLPIPRKALMVVAQAAATHAISTAKDHHDGYQMAKTAMQSLKPVAQQLSGQSNLPIG